MGARWDEFASEIESGEPDRVNAAIDEIAELDASERSRLFEDVFDGLTVLYTESDDGYVRQSCVRLAEQFAPGLVAAANVRDETAETDGGGAIVDRTDSLCGFFLEAMTDEDGRVRQSAARGLDKVFLTYDALDDRATVQAMIAELDEMADEYAGKRREHLLDARDDAEFTLDAGIGRTVREFQQER